MSAPKVTVIIPAYNCEKYIGRCINSILEQTYQDFVILVINDGSTDDTDKVLREYEKECGDKIKYVSQKNEGVAKTRNKAIRMAESEYVAFVDCDDFVDEDYLEKLLPRNGEDIILSGYRRPNNKGRIIVETKLKDEEWSKFIVPAPWAKIYRRDFLIKNDILFLDNNIGEDVYFNLIAMLTAKKVKILDYVGYNWYFNDVSVSNTGQKDFHKIDVMKLLNSSYNELEKRDLISKNREYLELFYYRYIVWFLLFSCKKQSKKEISKQYDELFSWLVVRFPEYRKNRYLRIGGLKGEVKKTRMIYKIFLNIQRLGAAKTLLSVYAKI